MGRRRPELHVHADAIDVRDGTNIGAPDRQQMERRHDARRQPDNSRRAGTLADRVRIEAATSACTKMTSHDGDHRRTFASSMRLSSMRDQATFDPAMMGDAGEHERRRRDIIVGACKPSNVTGLIIAMKRPRSMTSRTDGQCQEHDRRFRITPHERTHHGTQPLQLAQGTSTLRPARPASSTRCRRSEKAGSAKTSRGCRSRSASCSNRCCATATARKSPRSTSGSSRTGSRPPTRTDEIPFVVARVVLQDFTGVPLLVDLAAMRNVAARHGQEPEGDRAAGAGRSRRRPLGAGRLLRERRTRSI